MEALQKGSIPKYETEDMSRREIDSRHYNFDSIRIRVKHEPHRSNLDTKKVQRDAIFRAMMEATAYEGDILLSHIKAIGLRIPELEALKKWINPELRILEFFPALNKQICVFVQCRIAPTVGVIDGLIKGTWQIVVRTTKGWMLTGAFFEK